MNPRACFWIGLGLSVAALANLIFGLPEVANRWQLAAIGAANFFNGWCTKTAFCKPTPADAKEGPWNG
jgi:hypothetical protein